MNLVFTTDDLAPAKRYAAWQGAICDVYVHVDVNAEERSDYHGFIREARFGAVTMTDVLLSEQRISRRERHIAKLDKDCYYVELVQQGRVNVLQAGQTLLSNPGMGAIFSASPRADTLAGISSCNARVRSVVDPVHPWTCRELLLHSDPQGCGECSRMPGASADPPYRPSMDIKKAR